MVALGIAKIVPWLLALIEIMMAAALVIKIGVTRRRECVRIGGRRVMVVRLMYVGLRRRR